MRKPGSIMKRTTNMSETEFGPTEMSPDELTFRVSHPTYNCRRYTSNFFLCDHLALL